MSTTPKYNLPLYDSEDKPNLRDQYNNAMGILDSKLSEMQGDISDIESDTGSLKEEVAGKAPIDHASEDGEYGIASTDKYGHIKVVDAITKGAYGAPTSDALIKYVADATSHPFSGKDIVTIGDSIMLGTKTTNPASDAMYVKIGQMLGGTVYNYSENNAGFTTNGSGSLGTTYQGQIQAAASAHPDARLVVISGGINDSFNVDTVSSQAISAFNQAKAGFPNALIVVAPMQMGNNTFPLYNKGNAIGVYSSICEAAMQCGIMCVEDCWMINIGRSDLVNEDNIHPNTNGATVEAAKIVAGIMGWNYKPSYKGSLTPGSDFNNIDEDNSFISCVDGNVNMSFILKSGSADVDFNKTIVTIPDWAKRGVNSVIPLATITASSKEVGAAFNSRGNSEIKTITTIPANADVYAQSSFTLGC